ncbi:MAG TPA: hypothetical protein VEG68_13560 [Terriglobales bacterium]|nr:hypothetical protein [Terriglobales bacterium]
MKLTSSSIIAVLVLSCTAAFGQTTVRLGFLSRDKVTQYCDYVQITVKKSTVVTGTHFISTPGSTTCFNEPGLNGTMAGLATSIPASSGLPVTGTVATFADNTYDQQGGYMGACGCSEYYVSKLRPSTPDEIENNVYGWALYTNFGGTAALQNFGFTTKELGNNNENSEDSFYVY